MRASFCLLIIVVFISFTNDSLSQTIIYDTIKTGWVQAAPGKVSYADYAMVDNKGDIYAQVETGPDERSFCILQNGSWKKIEDRAFDRVSFMKTDPQKNIYVISGSVIYKKKDKQWLRVAGDSNLVYAQSIEVDNRFYGFQKFRNSGKIYTLVKWDGKQWAELGPGSMSLEFSTFPKFAADKKGIIYFATKDDNKANIVQCLSGTEIKEIGQMPGDISRLGIDGEGNLFISGSDAKYKVFCKSWNGAQWSDIGLPKEIQDHSTKIEFKSSEIRLNGLTTDPNDPRAERFFYKLEKGAWVKLGSYNSDHTIYEPFIANATQYIISRKNDLFLKWETGRIIKREVYPFTFQEAMSRTTELNENLAGMRLIKENNKYGVINNKGETLIFAAADNIKITRTPGSMSFYSFELLIKGQHFYTSVHWDKNPFSLSVGGAEKTTPCKDCNGKGRMGGINKTETVRGKWVEGTTTTTTRPSTMGGNQTTITTTPGYREPSTTKVVGKTDITSCSKCRGRGVFAKGWKDHLEYNSNNNTYTKRRENYAD